MRLYKKLVVVGMTAGFAAFGAVEVQAQGDKCATDYMTQKYFDENPGAEAQMKIEVEKITAMAQERAQTAGKTEDRDIVPVVVHIIHDDCEGNISEAQVRDGLRVINEDFGRTNADASETRDVFLPHAVDSEYEFRLAQIDPDGNPTNGIVRINSPLTYDAQNNVKFLSNWPSDQYFNIWVVRSIDNFGSTGTVLGYAQFPGGGSWSTYGIVIRSDAFGTIATSNADGRTLTHEVGHCFGLLHTFQSGCGSQCQSSGDYVCDTPPVGISTQACNQSQNTCGNDGQGFGSPYSSNVQDQIENYMSYDNCQNMFTSGQKDRMKSAMANYTQLVNLLSEANLTATGVNSISSADLKISYPIICAGGIAEFSDASTYGATSWDWTINGSATSSSTEENPSAVFNSPGLFSVSLSASDGTTTKNKTKSSYVLVAPQIGNFAPFSEGFEGIELPNQNWYGYNIDEDDYSWKHSDQAGHFGTSSVFVDNFGNCPGTEDELLSTTFDFSPYSTVNVQFWVAYAQLATGVNDALQLQASNDCGESWTPLWGASGFNLANGAMSATEFTPSVSGDWVSITADITNPAYLQEGVLLKFLFTGGGGNNLYLDDINILGAYHPYVVLEFPRNGALHQASDALLNWKAVDGIDEYEYQLDEAITFDSPTLLVGTKSFISTSPLNGDTEFETAGLTPNATYYWRVRSISGGAASSWSETWSFTVSASGVGVEENIAEDFKLNIYPNPMTGSATVAFELSETEEVQLSVYDLLGREVQRLVRKSLSSGQHQFMVDASQFEGGMYFVKLITGDKEITRKVIVH